MTDKTPQKIKSSNGAKKKKTMIEVRSLLRIYNERPVVHNLDLEVYGGEIFGLFGPNGSGKSTTIRMLTGLTRPNRGRIIFHLNGKDVDVHQSPLSIREHVGILTETPAAYGMELNDYLKFFGRLSRIPEDELSRRVLEVITIVGLEDHIYRRLTTMSTGEKQRAEIARVLLKDAPILFLDEPFSGIDIATRRELRDYLKKNWLNEERCIFFTSHNILESEHFVDRFAFILKGEVIATGEEKDLKKRFLGRKFVMTMKDMPTAQNGLMHLVRKGLIEDGEVVMNQIFTTLRSIDDMDEVLRSLVEAGITFHEIHPLGTIEDVFLDLTEDRKKEVNT